MCKHCSGSQTVQVHKEPANGARMTNKTSFMNMIYIERANKNKFADAFLLTSMLLNFILDLFVSCLIKIVPFFSFRDGVGQKKL